MTPLTSYVISTFCGFLSLTFQYEKKDKPVRLGGTTVLGIINNDSIYLAADSKEGMVQFKDSVFSTRKVFCSKKYIGATGGDFSGVYFHWKLYFNSSQILKDILTKGGEPEMVFYNFKKTMLDRLTKTITEYKKEDPSVNAYLLHHTLVFGAIGTFNKGRPELRGFIFNYVDNNGNWYIKIIERYDSTEMRLMSLGVDKEISGYVKSQEFPYTSISKSLAYLIKIECMAEPKTVGEPIDIVLLDKLGSKWITPEREYKPLLEIHH